MDGDDDDDMVPRSADASDDDEADHEEEPGDHEAARAPHDNMAELSELKQMCDQLAMAATIDKEHALLVMRIKSGMELLVLKCVHTKRMELRRLRNLMQLERMVIEHRASAEQAQKRHGKELEQQRLEAEQLKTVIAQMQQAKKR